MAIKYFFFSALLTIATTSCRSAAPRNEPEPVSPENPPPIAPSPDLSSRNTWIIQPTEQQYKYRSSTISSIVMEQGTISLRDSTSLTTDFSISLSRNARGASYSITVEGLSLTSAGHISPLDLSGLSSPVSLTGRIETNQISLSTPANCNNQVSSTFPVIQRSLILPPLQLRKGQTWTDSTSTAACSGSIPVMLTALRQYRVVGETNNAAHSGLLLERLDKTTSTGEGAEGQHRVQLKSEGTGQTQLLINPVTGTLLEATGTNTTLATVTTSGRSQKFTQISREHVVRR